MKFNSVILKNYLDDSSICQLQSLLGAHQSALGSDKEKTLLALVKYFFSVITEIQIKFDLEEVAKDFDAFEQLYKALAQETLKIKSSSSVDIYSTREFLKLSNFFLKKLRIHMEFNRLDSKDESDTYLKKLAHLTNRHDYF